MRLTKKDKYGHYYSQERAIIIPLNNEIPDKFYSEDITKLGQLEDIEEEIGIDLIKLMRALLDGFYFKKKGVICHSSFYPYPKFLVRRKQTLLRECCIIPMTGTFLYLVDYGITWALTKEELM